MGAALRLLSGDERSPDAALLVATRGRGSIGVYLRAAGVRAGRMGMHAFEGPVLQAHMSMWVAMPGVAAIFAQRQREVPRCVRVRGRRIVWRVRIRTHHGSPQTLWR